MPKLLRTSNSSPTLPTAGIETRLKKRLGGGTISNTTSINTTMSFEAPKQPSPEEMAKIKKEKIEQKVWFDEPLDNLRKKDNPMNI